MPKQSLTAMKVAFGVRAQYAMIMLVLTVFITQLIGVAIFSGNARAVGSITYDSKITSWNQGQAFSFDKDSAGNIYVADYMNNKIHKYSPSGQMLLEWGSSGIGEGQFGSYSPTRVAVDANDNVFVMDTANNRIQRFNTSGVYQSQFGSPGTGDGQFYFGYGLGGGIDCDAAGNVYVGDAGNHRVQKFNSSGVYQSQFGSSGSDPGQFTYINDVGVSPAGDIYVTEGTGTVSGTNRTQKFNSSGVVQVQFAQYPTVRPGGIDFDNSGNVYVADYGQDRFFKYDSDGNFDSWVRNTANGGKTYDVVYDGAGNFYTMDEQAPSSSINLIKKVDSSGTTLLTFSNALSGVLNKPSAVAVGPDGSIYAVSRNSHVVQKYHSDGTFERMIGVQGVNDGQFVRPTAVAVSPSNKVYVVDQSNFRIQRFAADGTFERKWGTQGSGNTQFNGALGITVDPSGNVYVADSGNARVLKFDADGNPIREWTPQMPGSGQPYATGIAADRYGNVYVVDPVSSKIGKYDQDGNLLLSWGGYGFGSSQFQYPYAVGVDPAGRVFVSQSFYNGTHKIKKYAADGTYITEFGSTGSGNGQFDFSDSTYQNAGGIAIGNNGKVYVADTNNNRIQIFNDNSFDLRLTTESAYNVAATDASLKLHSTDNADIKSATYGFEYGTTESYGSTITANGTGLSPVHSTTLSGTGYSGSLDATASVRDSQGNYYVQGTSCKVLKFDNSGTFLFEISNGCGGNMSDRFGFFPVPSAVDSSDNVYISQRDSTKVLKYDSDGNLLGDIDTSPIGIAAGVSDVETDPEDNVYVALEYASGYDTGHTILKYNSAGVLIDQIGSHGASDGQFSGTSGPRIVLDDVGNLYALSNSPDSKVQKFDKDGNFVTSWSANNASRIAIDRAHHILYTTNNLSDRIYPYQLDGTSLGYQPIAPSADQGIVGLVGADYSVTGLSNTTFNDYQREATASITGLECGTTYHYRAKAQVGSETVYGADQTFTTSACAQPISITTTSLPDGQVNTSYTQTITTNATDPVVTQIDGSLPPGLTLDSSGLLSGYPTAAGTYNFTLQAASNTPDFTGTDDQAYTLTIAPAQISLQTCDYDFGTGYPSEVTLSTSGGLGYPAFQIINGSMPAGLTLDGGGAITGTPTTPQLKTVRIRVSDLTGSDERDCTMRVFNGSPNLNTPMMSITTPTTNTTLQQDRVTVVGKGPMNSTIAVYIDNYQVGTTTTDGAGNWSYLVTNIFPGTHTFDAKWLPAGNVVVMGTFYTLGSPVQSALNLVDTGINKVVKRYYTEQVPSASTNVVLSSKHHKAYEINAVRADVPTGWIINLTEVNLDTGKNTDIVENIQASDTAPLSLKVSDDGDTLYAVTATKVITYDVGQGSMSQFNLPVGMFDGEPSFAGIVSNNDKTKLYVVDSLWGNNDINRKRRISVINLSDSTVSINDYGEDGLLNRNGYGFHYAARSGSTLYATYPDGKILIYDTTNNTVAKVINLNLTNNNTSGDYESLYSASFDAQHKIMYVTIVHEANQIYKIVKVNLETDETTTLHTGTGPDFLYPFNVYDSYTQSLYIQGVITNGDGSTNLRQFSLGDNQYASGADDPIVDENPGDYTYGFSDNVLFSPADPFVASVTYTYNLPAVDPPKQDPPKPPSVDSNPEPPTVTDVTPPSSGTKSSSGNPSRINTTNQPTASSNSLLALVARLPQPIAIGFPWLLLLLALILVSIQYYQVHSEQMATKKMQQSVEKQQQLVDEQNNFVALTTHYLHTPLTVLEGEISLMVKAGTMTEAQATKLKAALTSLNSETEQILQKEESS